MRAFKNATKKRLGKPLAVCATVSIVLALGAGRPAMADEAYPSRPLQIIVGYAAGGGTDRQARLLAKPLEDILGQPVTVQNLPGGGGQVAVAALLRDKADGYTILAGNQPDINMAVVIDKAPYALEDLQVIMVDLFDPRILLVRKDSPYKTFDDFVKQAKANPDKLSVSITEGGGQQEFAKWLFAALGLKVRFVGYSGGSNAANAMVGGLVDATVGDDSARMNIREQSRALLLGSPKKSPRWPEAATMVEALKPYGVTPPTPDFLGRYGIYAVPSAFKKGYPEQYAKLQKAMIDARQAKSYQEVIAKGKIEDLSIGEPGEAFEGSFAKSTNAIKAATK